VQVTPRARLMLRLQGALFVVLFLGVIGLLAWASARYSVQFDWTATGRNTLSEPSRRLLERLHGPIEITAYATQTELLRGRIRDLVDRYRRRKPDVRLEFVNPDTVPEQVRRLNVTVNGELLVDYRGRTEHVREHTEQALTNALQRLARSGERWLVYLTGHGERDLLGEANHDLGRWGRQLQAAGFQVQPLNLAEAGAIPENTALVVIAGPQVAYLEGEVALLRRYLEGGGNLLWLADPGPLHGLAPLAETLGLAFADGVVVDPTLQRLGVGDATFVPVSRYPEHPVTREFELLTVYPEAAALEVEPRDGWRATPIVETGPRAWLETGALEGEIAFDEGADRPGPLTLGYAHERSGGPGDGGSEDTPSQRAVVVADGDFLSNTYLGNQGNLDLGMNMVNWLASDERLIAIPARMAPDAHLNLSRTASAVMVAGVFGLPALLLAVGVGVWLRRRRR